MTLMPSVLLSLPAPMRHYISFTYAALMPCRHYFTLAAVSAGCRCFRRFSLQIIADYAMLLRQRYCHAYAHTTLPRWLFADTLTPPLLLMRALADTLACQFAYYCHYLLFVMRRAMLHADYFAAPLFSPLSMPFSRHYADTLIAAIALPLSRQITPAFFHAAAAYAITFSAMRCRRCCHAIAALPSMPLRHYCHAITRC